MLKQVFRHVLPERIEGEVHAFSTCELRSRNEVSVAGYENDHVRLAFQRDRRNVEPDAHIDALLSQRRTEGVVSQIVDGRGTLRATAEGQQCGRHAPEHQPAAARAARLHQNYQPVQLQGRPPVRAPAPGRFNTLFWPGLGWGYRGDGGCVYSAPMSTDNTHQQIVDILAGADMTQELRDRVRSVVNRDCTVTTAVKQAIEAVMPSGRIRSR